MNIDVARIGALCFLVMLQITGCVPMSPSAKEQSPAKVEGHIDSGTYLSPGKLFRVAVPKMRNPFIKQPALVWDENTSDGGVEVNFAVPDLGEAHRFGVRPLDDTTVLEGVFNEELGRWTRKWVHTLGKTDIILEEKVQLADGTGLARVYLVESASLLFVRHGEGTPRRESALIEVIVIPVSQKRQMMYVVSQFDMPNHGYYTLETENGRKHLAKEQMHQVRQLIETFRLQ